MTTFISLFAFIPPPFNYTSVIDWWCLGVVLESIGEKLGEK